MRKVALIIVEYTTTQGDFSNSGNPISPECVTEEEVISLARKLVV